VATLEQICTLNSLNLKWRNLATTDWYSVSTAYQSLSFVVVQPRALGALKLYLQGVGSRQNSKH